MDGSFTITADVARGLMLIKIAGFVSPDQVARFAAERLATVADLERACGGHVTLCDISECRLQSQEVLGAFRTLLDDPRVVARRTAFITGDSPARMQLRRLLDDERRRCFDTAVPAWAWLFAADTQAAA